MHSDSQLKLPQILPMHICVQNMQHAVVHYRYSATMLTYVEQGLTVWLQSYLSPPHPSKSGEGEGGRVDKTDHPMGMISTAYQRAVRGWALQLG